MEQVATAMIVASASFVVGIGLGYHMAVKDLFDAAEEMRKTVTRLLRRDEEAIADACEVMLDAADMIDAMRNST